MLANLWKVTDGEIDGVTARMLFNAKILDSDLGEGMFVCVLLLRLNVFVQKNCARKRLPCRAALLRDPFAMPSQSRETCVSYRF